MKTNIYMYGFKSYFVIDNKQLQISINLGPCAYMV
jgi:hypothetical protein